MDVNHFNEIVRENNRIRDEALESGEITGFNYNYYIKTPLKPKNGNPYGTTNQNFWKLWKKNKAEMKLWIKVRKHAKLMLSKNTFLKDVYTIELQFRVKKELIDNE